MKQLLISLVIASCLFSCAKQEFLSTSQTELLASKGGVVPNYLPGPCPYPCTDTRCQAYQNGYCGTGNTTISVKTNTANVYDNVGNQHNQGVASILPTINFSTSNLDSVVLVKVKAFVVTIGYNADSMQTFYNKAVQRGYFPFSKIQELDSLGNKLAANGLLSSYGNTYVQQMFSALTQYLNTDSVNSTNYNLFANKLISIESSIKNDTRISSYEKQVLLSGASVGRYSAAYWGNQFQGGSTAAVVSPMLFQKWKRWLRMLCSLFVQTGPASGGWTAYPPLSILGDASPGSKTGMDIWLISLICFIISTLLGGINYVSTILNLRTKGMSMTRLPLTIWALFFTAVLGILSFPVLLAAFVLLIFDRHFGTSFYLSDIFLSSTARALPNNGGSALLYQHLFWFLGHPEVYIVILPAMGIVSEVISVNSRKPIFGYTAMVGSLFAIMVLSFMVWAHHMFVSGMNPFLGSIFVLLTLLIAVPSAIKVFNWLTTLWRGNIRFTPAMLFAVGFVSVFISGGLTGIWLGNAALDIHLHDTYFIVAHFHLVMGVAAMMGMFAGIYHWFPKMFGHFMNDVLGYIHFWITLIGSYLIFWPMHYEGLAGMPRRYYDYSAWVSFNQFEGLNKMISIVSIFVFAVQLLFLMNFFYSIFKGRKVKVPNPWGANTLEWTTPIKLIHGNWPGEIPMVYREAYEYGKAGMDFNPQTNHSNNEDE